MMKTYKKLYEKLYSEDNLILAFKKARKGKRKKDYVISFESDLNRNKDFIELIKIVLDNFETPIKGKGLPLGNYTSQFFANVYLNGLDYFIKHKLRAKYYIRYVDDFIILHKEKKVLSEFKSKIEKYLKNLRLELHPDKSKIHALRNGITFLGYRIFYHYKLLRKKNINYFLRRLEKKIDLYSRGLTERKDLESFLQGWFGYSKFANTYNFRKNIEKIINRNI